MCELYVLSHLHENLSGLGASTVCLLYTAQLSCQKTWECETFLCVECTKPNWRKNCTSTRISITGPTAVRMTQKDNVWNYSFFILQQDCFPFDHHEGWGTDLHNYPVNDGFHTYMCKFSVSNHLRTQPLIRESMVKRPTYYSNKLWTVSVLMRSDLTYQGCW